MKSFFLLIFFCCYTQLFAQFKSDSVTFFFAYDSSIPLDNEVLIEKIISSGKLSEIQLIAYTDTSGTEDYNQKLALRRAQAVKNLLPSNLKYVQTIIIGESINFGSDENNRRVDMKFKVPLEGKMIREVSNLDIKFVGNQAIVLPKSFNVVDELVAKIKAGTYTKIEIHGHVCCRPDQSLSERRALAIQDILVENGVDESIISTYGHSNSRPLVPEFTESDFEKNRRVEVVLIKNEMKY
jgi:outer membrane protein OmpA-like peptidoglycan-associated protein